MERSFSEEANGRSVDKGISSLLWNPNVHYHAPKTPATSPSHEPDESNPHPHTLFL